MQIGIIRYLLTISIVFILTCQLPTNPFLDPDNVIVKLTTMDKKVSAVQGDSISLCVQVNFPNLITNMGVMINGCKKDTVNRTYYKGKPSANIPDTIRYTFTCPGSYIIIGYAKLSNGNFKYDSINFRVPQMQCVAMIHDQGAGVGNVKFFADTTNIPYTVLNDSI